MGIYDRDYVREGRGGVPSGRGRGGVWSFNTWLIVVNIGVFVVQALLLRPYTSNWTGLRGDWLFQWGHFSTSLSLDRIEVWRLVTFQFLHAGLLHLAFNMIGLYFFGPLVEQYLGRKRYAAYYLLCGVCGGLLYLLLNLVGWMGVSLPGALAVNPATPLIGASAGVFGVIVACAYIAPNTVVQLLIPPIPLKMRTFAYGYVALVAANLFFFRGANQGGDAAHLGGALAGYFFIRRPHLLRDFFDVLGNSNLQGKKRGGKDIDAILAKVQREGIHSLSDSEKRALRKATEERRG